MEKQIQTNNGMCEVVRSKIPHLAKTGVICYKRRYTRLLLNFEITVTLTFILLNSEIQSHLKVSL